MFGFGRTVKVEASRGALLGDGEFAFNIVGESHYQKEIASIVGGKTREGHKDYCAAVLSPEPTNPHDRKAVVVTIHNRTVGYLSRDDCDDFKRALERAGFTAAACEALICGGWLRSDNDQGDFGVKLNAVLPFRIVGPREYWAQKRP